MDNPVLNLGMFIMYSIYKIENTITKKVYFGKTKNFKKRIASHKSQLRCGSHPNSVITNDFNEYGIGAFCFSIISENLTHECACEMEELLIHKGLTLGNCYNIGIKSIGGDNISFNPKKDEIKMKMSRTMVERYSNMSDSDREKIRERITGELNGMYGKHHSNDAREKISLANKGNSRNKGISKSDSHRLKMSEIAKQRIGDKNHFFGKKHSSEAKEKISKSRIGIKPSNQKEIVIDGVKYCSATEASRILGIHLTTIAYRAKSKNYTNYEYI